ncbi:TPA: Arc family DNA-binding protein [Klebsiella variicola]
MKGASQIAPLGIRLPEELREKIKEKAKENGRSVNSEIVQMLEDALNNDAQGHDRELEIVSEAYEEHIKSLEKIINVQSLSMDLAKEQIALLKQHIKATTGFDVQKYFEKVVDYDAISKSVEETFKSEFKTKPTRFLKSED